MHKNYFTLGYNNKLYDTVLKKCTYGARCESCRYFGEGDLCTNNQVTSFDITITKDRTYCIFWKPTSVEDFEKTP